MNKIDLMYDMMVDQRNSLNSIDARLNTIEEEVGNLKEFRGRLTGGCLAISTVIGFIPSVLKYLHS